MLAVALVTGCGDHEPAALRAGDLTFTESELLGLDREWRERLGTLAAFGQAVADGRVEAMGEPLVEARRRAWFERVLDAERTLDAAGVDDDVLLARYRQDPALELTVRHLIVLAERFQTGERRALARGKAEAALARIRAGEPFPEVAAQVSEEPGAEGRQGLLNPGREGAWVPEFWNAARALEPGEISGVVETEYGFHVLRLEARDTVPFAEARTRLALEVAALVDPDFDRDSVPELPSGVVLADGAPAALGGEAPDSLEVARWDGGRMTLGQARRRLAALERTEWERGLASDASRAEALREQIALAAAVARAEALGISMPEAVLDGYRSEWKTTADRWAAALGFSSGLANEAVEERALAAQAAAGQGPTLVREEMRRRAPLIRYAIPVVVAP